jgi:hypothetical protein
LLSLNVVNFSKKQSRLCHFDEGEITSVALVM